MAIFWYTNESRGNKNEIATLEDQPITVILLELARDDGAVLWRLANHKSTLDFTLGAEASAQEPLLFSLHQGKENKNNIGILSLDLHTNPARHKVVL